MAATQANRILKMENVPTIATGEGDHATFFSITVPRLNGDFKRIEKMKEI
jgi:hypothetical protein